jgi:hypothetical protein
MEDRCVEADPSPLGRIEGVDDQVGAFLTHRLDQQDLASHVRLVPRPGRRGEHGHIPAEEYPLGPARDPDAGSALRRIRGHDHRAGGHHRPPRRLRRHGFEPERTAAGRLPFQRSAALLR